MKYLIVAASLLLGHSAFSCVDISGKYQIENFNFFYVQYEQNSCESLTEKWCTKEKGCPATGRSWPLNGTLQRYGEIPSDWSSIVPEGETLRRTRFWGLGTQYQEHQCSTKDQWYAKDPSGNLIVTYKLTCVLPNLQYQDFTDVGTWTRIN